MIFVDNQQVTDPAVNLAIEEHLLRNFAGDEEILLFYINEPSIIIGRNQNTLEEINHEYVEAHGIHVVRRLSGGGAVYHDLGNLNFSFISLNRPENVQNFKKFTEPVVRALQGMGVPAQMSGRNDILVEGRKISGNAQYVTGKRMVSHGTLLLDTDLSQVVEALNVKMSKITSKGLKSVRSRVANIAEFLPEPVSMEKFRLRLLNSIFAGAPGAENGSAGGYSDLSGVPQYRLTEADWESIRRLSGERYRNWDWNYGRSPDFNVQKTHRFPIGEIDARIDVQRGVICGLKFYGDFFGQADVSELEQRLAGVRYTRQDLAEALQGVDINAYFHGLSSAEFLKFLY